MNLFKKSILGLALATGFAAQAQQLPVLNHYIYNPFLLNPAMAGSQSQGNLFVHYKRQWDAMPEAPQTMALSFDSPIRKANIGLGFMVYNDNTQLINRTGGIASYAYQLKFSKTKLHRLNIGVGAHLGNQRIDFARAVATQPDNTILNSDANGFYADANAGLAYQNGQFTLGISAPALLATGISYYQQSSRDKKVSFANVRQFNVLASYAFGFGGKDKRDFVITPTAMVRYIETLPINVDGQLQVSWKDKFWLGGGYRFYANNPLNITAGVRVKERFMLSYTFEPGSVGNATAQAMGNSHELTIGYRFGGRTKELDLIDSLADVTKKMGKNQKALRERMDLQDTTNIKNDERDSLAQQRMDRLENDLMKANQKDMEAMKQMLDKNAKEIQILRERLEKMNSGKFSFKKIGSVNFEVNSAEMTAEGKRKADALKDMVTQKGNNYVIYIAGRASEEGESISNLVLSLKRAVAVKNYLQSLGMSTDQVVLLPYGEEAPDTKSQKSESERKQERRVDLFITGEEGEQK